MLKTYSKNKKTKTLNAFIAISLITILFLTLYAPLTSAQTGLAYPRKTMGYIIVAPTLIGVHQQATVTIFITPLAEDFAGAPIYPNGFSGITVSFTRPDGTKDTFMPTHGNGFYSAGVTDTLGSLYFLYAPDMAGNWSTTVSMPAQNFTTNLGTASYTACTSETTYFTVTTEAQSAGLLNGYPWSPLPNDNAYWTIPVNSNNREWSEISGDWLGAQFWDSDILNNGANVQWYGSGPSSGHILWKMQYGLGGLVGGAYGSSSYAAPTYFANEFAAQTAIMNGKIYMNDVDAKTFKCIDLYTGKVLWTQPGKIDSGIHLPGNAYAQGAAVNLASSLGGTPAPYLWGSAGPVNLDIYQRSSASWNYYDINTGSLMLTIANVTNGAHKFVDGTPLAYSILTSDFNSTTQMYKTNQVVLWNMTKVVGNDWYTGIQWIAHLNNPAIGEYGPGDGSGRSGLVLSSDYSTIAVIGTGGNLAKGFDAITGKSKWNITLPYVSLTSETQCIMALQGTNDFLLFDDSSCTFHCYSTLTGNELWSRQIGLDGWSTKMSKCKVNDNDNVYLGSPDGTMTALSLADGHIVWQTDPIPSSEYITNALPYFEEVKMGGGVIYGWRGPFVAYEINPVSRFGELVALNATTGDTIFTLNGGLTNAAVYAGYLACFGNYDGSFYMLGKGKTATTVSASPKVGASGSGVLIEGTVMDQSPAQPDTPAVSDADMSEFMDYLHMQNATLLNNPPAPKGVTVRLSVVDPNGNVQDIGTVTSDHSGVFKKMWTPEIEGEYMIYATFDGSDSYWGSYAATALGVSAASPTATSELQQIVDYMSMMYAILAVGIIAIIIGLIAIFKKR